MERKLEVWFDEMYNLNTENLSKEIDTLKNELRIKHLEIYNLELRLFAHHLMKNIKSNKIEIERIINKYEEQRIKDTIMYNTAKKAEPEKEIEEDDIFVGELNTTEIREKNNIGLKKMKKEFMREY